MSPVLLSTPLIGLKGAALDTETTGLDVRKARLIEVGIAPIEQGRLAEPCYSQLIDCREPIPPASSAVHGLKAADLAGQPDFAAIAPDLLARLDGRVVIGHTIGFDLALIRRELERAGLKVPAFVALDVRILAQITQPQLSSYSLEGLTAWLQVEPGERHRALGDAVTAGRVFLALVPKLREAGIRTLGEALARCKLVTDAMAGVQPVEWDVPARPADAESALPRLDQYPYSHRIRDVMNANPVLLPETTTLAEALKVIAQRKLSSVLVGERLDDAATVGIVTERDIMRVLADKGSDGFPMTLGAIATRPLLTIPEDALIYRAIGRMANRNIRHLAAVGVHDEIVGVVTTRDLLKLRASSAIALGDDIDAAESVPALAAAWAKLPGMARALVAEGVPARAIAAVIAREVGALTRRAAQLAESELAAGPLGPAPCDYAILVLGSAGRGESLLAMDQDNAVIFAEGEPDGPHDRWFAAHGRRMCAILHEVGVPLCKGGVMASEPAFRGSVALWRERIGQWLTRARPQDLLAVDIFFDFRAVHGRRALAARLWRDAWEAARGEIAFLKLLAEDLGESGGHISLLGRIRADEDGRIDLKPAALKGIVTAARVMALRHGVLAHATADRLAGLIAQAQHGLADLKGLDADHQLVLNLILRQQLADISAGRPASNRVTIKALTVEEQGALKAALQRQGAVTALVRDVLTE